VRQTKHLSAVKVADALRTKHDKLGALMDTSREDVLAYMDYPRSIGTSSPAR
jgi:hypothetical protein